LAACHLKINYLTFSDISIEPRLRENHHFQTYWWQRRHRWLSALTLLLAFTLTLLVPHDQRHLHMPEPWSDALAAQNFTQGT
jgi:hypothetical protein